MMNPAQFVAQVRSEAAKVVWPSRKEDGLTTMMVFVLALLAMTLPFYIRAIYNISIPSASLISTFWIFLGVVLLFVLDWILRQWRSSLLSQLGGRLDALIGVTMWVLSLLLVRHVVDGL
mgnify:CR=1 FL=1